jgi:hypothetical protein
MGSVTKVVFTASIAAMLSGCDVAGPEDEFLLRLDSIVAPSTVTATDSLVVTFVGYRSSPDCPHELQGQSFRNSQELTIWRSGAFRSGSDECRESPVPYVE